MEKYFVKEGLGMVEKREIFKTIILFLFFVYGCSHKYVDAEEEVGVLWRELDCRIVGQDEQGFSLGVGVKNFAFIDDSLKSRGIHELKSPGEGDLLIAFGVLGGLGGCLAGCNYGLSSFSWDGSGQEEFDRGTLISFTSCAAGLVMMFVGIDRNRKSRCKVSRIMPYFEKVDTVCVGSEAVSARQVKILIKMLDFKETYWTDEEGNIKLKFNEIIPDPTEADSVLNLIIRYGEMADTVNVEIR